MRVGTRTGLPWRRGTAKALAGLGFILLSPIAAHGQITLDGSLGSAGSLSGPSYVIGAGMGQVRGTNLFHSFGQFNVRSSESATFTGPSDISNILSRVTGGQASMIDGLIDSRTSMPSANFFLLNPSGIMFGPGAVLNVGGSFHVSTADYVRFADGAQFFAQLAPASALSVTAPVAFGFLGPNPAAVSLEGSALAADPGQTLSIVAGAVTLRGATLQAPGGRVQIAASAGAGELPIGNVEAGSVPQFGPVEISGGSFLDATGDPGGIVLIRAGRLVIEGATVSTGTMGDVDPATTVGIDIWAQEEAVLSGAFVQTLASAGGRAGDVLIAAGSGPADGTVRLSGGSVVFSLTGGPGRGGDVRLTAGRITLDDAGIATVSQFGEGVGGDVTLTGGVIALTGGASIQSVNQNFTLDGRGGSITVRASDSVLVSGQNASAIFSNLASVTNTAGDGGQILVSAPSLTMGSGTSILSLSSFEDGPGGSAGPITVDVGRLALTGGATINSINSATVPASEGVSFVGGAVTVTATGQAEISGGNSGIFSVGFGAPPGDITVRAGMLRLTDGALIQGGSFAGESEGGNVTVGASGSILIADGAGISSQAFNLDVGRVAVSASSLTIDGGFINTGTLGVGRAGDIAIDVGTLTLSRGGQIASSNIFTASGSGGTVTVNAGQSVSISGTSPEPVLPDPFRGFVNDTASGIFTTASSDNPVAGAAGSIIVSSPQVTITDGGKLDSSTTGAGRGGIVTVNAPGGSLTISGSGSGLFSNTGPGSGMGGDIKIVAQQIELRDGAVVSASSTGTAEALAGNINITFGELLDIRHSSITTESTRADGGNIAITSTGSLLYLLDSQITTSVKSDAGQGGNITIGTEGHPIDFVVLNGSEIRADAFGGPGGNISILADVFLTSSSVLSASSALSTPGTINIEASITDVSGALGQLPENILQAAALLRAACAARLAQGKTSSLVVSGREGRPPEPDDLLWSPLAEGPATSSLSWTNGHEWEPFPRFARVTLTSKCER